MMNTTCYRLVVCEKPSVARSIAAVLGAGRREDGFLSGGGYLVSWCFGHLAELSDADAYDEKYGKWRREDLPILPDSWQYTVARDKQKQMNTLRTLMHREDVCEVVNACDAGREGELIFRTAYKSQQLPQARKAALDLLHGGCGYPSGLWQSPRRRGVR